MGCDPLFGEHFSLGPVPGGDITGSQFLCLVGEMSKSDPAAPEIHLSRHVQELSMVEWHFTKSTMKF